MESKYFRRSKSACRHHEGGTHSNFQSANTDKHSHWKSAKFSNSGRDASTMQDQYCGNKKDSRPGKEKLSSFFSVDEDISHYEPTYPTDEVLNTGAQEKFAFDHEKEPRRVSKVKFAKPLIRKQQSLSKLNNEENFCGESKSKTYNGTDNFVKGPTSGLDVSNNRVDKRFLDVNKYVREPRDSLTNLSEVQKKFEKVMLENVKRVMPELSSLEIKEKLLKSKKPPQFYFKPEHIVKPESNNEELARYAESGSILNHSKSSPYPDENIGDSCCDCIETTQQNFSNKQLKMRTLDDDIAEMEERTSWILHASSKILASLDWK